MKEDKKANIENDLQSLTKDNDITRKEAIRKIGTYGKHAAFISLSTYLILTPKKGQAQSVVGGAGSGTGSGLDDLGTGFDD